MYFTLINFLVDVYNFWIHKQGRSYEPFSVLTQVAILQSAGAAGIGAAATAGLAAGGGAVGLAAGGATAVGVNKLMGSEPSQENETNNGNETETLKHEDGEKGDEKGEGRSGNDEKEERKEEEGRLGNDEEEENK